MNKFSLGAKKRPNIVAPEKQQWRAYDHGPISLSSRPAVDSATGQKAFVLAFAAVAVAGAAYFATVMIAPEDDPTSVITRANASTQDIRAAAQPVEPAPVAAEAAAPAEAPAQVAAVEQPAVADTPPAPSFPAPVRVKTITVPSAKKAEVATASAAEPAPAAAEPVQIASADPVADAAQEPAAPVIVGGVKQVEKPEEMTNAYANTEGLVSEGIVAVMGVAAREANGVTPVRKVNKPTEEPVQVASAEPEMAGGGGGGRKIRTAVTMRAGPQKGAAPIGTIPTNASVTVAPGCKSWCQVSYNGKRGYIYKGFLR